MSAPADSSPTRTAGEPLSRRSLLGGLVAMLVAGCANGTPVVKPPETPPPRPPPGVHIAALTDLLAGAGLNWLVLARPEQLAAVPWLKPSLARVLRDERIDLLAHTTGLDLRRVPELALASYSERDAVLYLVRHDSNQLDIERLFRGRLTRDVTRGVAGNELIRVTGRIGVKPRAFVALGPDVAGYQYGGNVERGPARVALLYAAGRLEPKKVPTVMADPILAPLTTALANAPLQALLPGPFEGHMARGARGLLAASAGLGASLTPTDGESLALHIILLGDYSANTERATELLGAAWTDLTTADLGHLLGLHEPEVPPTIDCSEGQLQLRAELDAASLCKGLAAATTDSIAEIMR